ncbi:hypothetical protein ABTP08_21275, partial [Acinetobacter baumannii]
RPRHPAPGHGDPACGLGAGLPLRGHRSGAGGLHGQEPTPGGGGKALREVGSRAQGLGQLPEAAA